MFIGSSIADTQHIFFLSASALKIENVHISIVGSRSFGCGSFSRGSFGRGSFGRGIVWLWGCLDAGHLVADLKKEYISFTGFFDSCNNEMNLKFSSNDSQVNKKHNFHTSPRHP
jgi:hypothetical protein